MLGILWVAQGVSDKEALKVALVLEVFLVFERHGTM